MGLMNRMGYVPSDKGVVSTESIDFQSGDFFKELSEMYDKMTYMKLSEIISSGLIDDITDRTKHYTGLTINLIVLDTVGVISPYVKIPEVDANNPIINDYIKPYFNNFKTVKHLKRTEGKVSGSVNINTGRVTGYFSTLENEICMPYPVINGKLKLTGEELAAMYLHELGHLFTYFEFITRVSTTNQVLALMAKELTESTGPAEREAILSLGKKHLKLNVNEKDLVNSDDKTITVVYITESMRIAESELGANIYDYTTWEYLSDQFASRHGAGTALVTGLSKFHKFHGNIAYRSTSKYYFMEGIKLVALILSLVTVLVFPIALFSTLMWLYMDGYNDPSYDMPGYRTKRIRDQIVTQLKNNALDKENKESLLTQLTLIDDALKGIKDRNTLFSYLGKLLSSSKRKNLKQAELQQRLESLAFNDLFVKSAQLTA